MSTSESWGVNRHTARYTSPVSVVSQCKLVSGWKLRKRRSAPPYGPCGSGRTLLLFYIFTNIHALHISNVRTQKHSILLTTVLNYQSSLLKATQFNVHRATEFKILSQQTALVINRFTLVRWTAKHIQRIQIKYDNYLLQSKITNEAAYETGE